MLRPLQVNYRNPYMRCRSINAIHTWVPSPVPDWVPMALVQLNLKLPASVLADWRRRAAAQELTVRDWLLSVTSSPDAPLAGPEAAAVRQTLQDLDQRLQALERAPTAVPASVAAAAPSSRPDPVSDPPALADADGVIESSELARILGLKRGTLNARIARLGGPVAGLMLDGWRCLGLRHPHRGGPPRAVWMLDSKPGT